MAANSRAKRSGARKAPARANGNGRSPAALTAIPDVSGTDGMVDVLLGLLDQSGRRRKHLEAVRVANDDKPDDPVAGMPATRPDGTVNSYRLLLSELDVQERRLADKWPEEMERVRELVRKREAERTEG